MVYLSVRGTIWPVQMGIPYCLLRENVHMAIFAGKFMPTLQGLRAEKGM